MNYYQFNIGNYRRDTIGLSLLEHGIYRTLLDSYYLEERPLCADDAKLMRSHNVRTSEEKEAFRNIMDDFFVLTEDGYRHSACDEVLEAIYEKSEKARQSAAKRWDKHANASKKNANASESQTERNANGMLPNTQYPIPNNPSKENGVANAPAQRKRFTPPEVKDVRLYFFERTENRELSFKEGEKFINHYESNGWLVGKNKMKDWKAAVRNWITRMDEKPKTAHQERVDASNRTYDPEANLRMLEGM